MKQDGSDYGEVFEAWVGLSTLDAMEYILRSQVTTGKTIEYSGVKKAARRIVAMNNYVLSRAMAPLMIVAEKRGLDEAELVEGLSFDHG